MAVQRIKARHTEYPQDHKDGTRDRFHLQTGLWYYCDVKGNWSLVDDLGVACHDWYFEKDGWYRYAQVPEPNESKPETYGDW